MARAWGCTPAQLRECTPRDLALMLRVLRDEQRRARKAGA